MGRPDLLREYLKRIVVIRDRKGKLLDYDIDWEPLVEINQRCVVVKFGIRIRGEDKLRRITLVLYRYSDGGLTGGFMVSYGTGYRDEEGRGIEVYVNLDAVPLHKLEEVLL